MMARMEVGMSVLQVWLIIGIPVLVAVVVLLVGGSPVRARIAFALIVVLAVVLAIVPAGGGASIALLALPATVIIASGRLEGSRALRHHETRRRLTTAGGD